MLVSCGLCGCVSQVVVVAARKHSNYTPTDDQHATSTPLAEQINFAYKRADDAPNETQRATSTPNPEHINFGSKSADYAPSDNRRAISRPKPEHLYNIYKTVDSKAKEGVENIHEYFQLLGFFLESKLAKGSTMHLGMNFLEDAANPKRDFLPRAVAHSLPALKASNLPKLLQAFNVREGTEMATNMEKAISYCEGIVDLAPEEKPALCPTSKKAMTKFVSSQFGENVELLTTTVVPAKPPAVNDPVTVLDYHTYSADTIAVVCHSLSFPSQVYYCHKLSKTRLLQATLKAGDGSHINAVAICHLDTSWWSSSHPVFAALNVPRGTEVCHWAVKSTLVWVRSNNT